MRVDLVFRVCSDKTTMLYVATYHAADGCSFFHETFEWDTRVKEDERFLACLGRALTELNKQWLKDNICS